MNLTFGSGCSGIEAASVAWEPLGWKAAWFAQHDPEHDYSRGPDFASAVLAHHWPHVQNVGDMTGLPGLVRFGEIEAPDVLVAGTPCQSFSIAGLRAGLSDPRGGLALAYVELADEVDRIRIRNGHPPAIVVWENVPGVLSSKDNAFGCFLAAMAGDGEPYPQPTDKRGNRKPWADAGVVFGPKRAIAWRVVDAQYFGLAQRRRRVYLVASAREDFHPAQVLLEWDGVRRDSAPSREAGEEAPAGTLRSSDGGCDVDHAQAGHVVACMAHGQGGAEISSERSPTLTCNHEAPIVFARPYQSVTNSLCASDAKGVNGQHVADHKLIPVAFDTTQVTSPANRSNPKPGDPCHTLSKGAHVPLIAFSCKDYGADASEISPTLRAMGHSGSHPNGGGQIAVCVTGEITHTLRAEGFDASEDGTGRGNPIIPTVAFNVDAQPDEMRFDPHTAAALTCSQRSGVMQDLAVRRLIPTECERLQGFPDEHTNIPYRKKDAADGPRYKVLGNSMAVACMGWLGRRIEYGLRRPWR